MKEYKVTFFMGGLAGDGFEPVELTTRIKAKNEDEAHTIATIGKWFKVENKFIYTENGVKKEDKTYDFIAVDKIHNIHIREVKLS